MDLLAARGQMAMSLGFHILFAVAGMAMPVLMVMAEWRALRRNDDIARELAHRWAKGTAILFAVGAVSGTVLSFELGLLWPKFMQFAGPLIGMPFSLEGFAFFLEAIFLGLYLYGWQKLPPRVHLACGVVVALSGVASGVFVVAVNAFMNTPAGLLLQDGQVVSFDPYIAFFSPAFATQAVHMVLAAYASIAFVVLGIHAWPLLHTRMAQAPNRLHTTALELALWLAALSVPAQIVSGDLIAKAVARNQPVKLAAAEGHFHTEEAAPIHLGGWPDEEKGELRYAVRVPYALSILAKGSPTASVQGLNDFDRKNWPPVAIVHISFQVMVASGMAMLGILILALWTRWRRHDMATQRLLLWLFVLGSPLGLLALETGWIVTEVGRQPWIIHGIMRTADAVTPMPGLVVPFLAFTALYVVLGIVVILLLRAHVFAATRGSQP